MIISRTTESTSVVPELVYADVAEAIQWLCETFGFAELWRVDGHRARLAFGNGVVIVADHDPNYGRAAPDDSDLRSYSIMVKVESVDAHYDHARQRGRTNSQPANRPLIWRAAVLRRGPGRPPVDIHPSHRRSGP